MDYVKKQGLDLEMKEIPLSELVQAANVVGLVDGGRRIRNHGFLQSYLFLWSYYLG